jgi:hypothetical protein
VRVVQAVQSHRTLSALSSIAAALAPTDPDRAARLFTDAERIANSITGGFLWGAATVECGRSRNSALAMIT